jgi:hypothetical protein
LLISAENTVIPPQVIIYSPKGANNTTALLFGTSLYDLKEGQPTSSGDLIVKDGLRLFAIEPALTKVPEAFFAAKPVRVEDSARYLRALDCASIDLNIAPFAAFLAERVGWSVSQLHVKHAG